MPTNAISTFQDGFNFYLKCFPNTFVEIILKNYICFGWTHHEMVGHDTFNDDYMDGDYYMMRCGVIILWGAQITG